MQALTGVEIEVIEARTGELLRPVQALRDELVIELSSLYNMSGFQKEKQLLGQIEGFKWGITRGEYIHANAPSHYMTRDSEAMNQGVKVPAHLFYQAVAAECASRCSAAEEFLKLAQRVLRPLETAQAVQDIPRTPQGAVTGKKIFIGHGRSLVWLLLKDFLSNRLNLQCDEFNEQSVAGKATVARLNQMLDDAQFAFLVMTAEDRHANDTAHARENVIHEAGLFQGRLGFERAIILLEQGCAEFSNIHGLTVIKFRRNKLDSAFEEIRRVLEREQIIPHL
jgi:predicted nucleotide-binding protein